jgi:glyoxylase-like metal-dependent hydrolase (beta-lactamase superfamily II)
LAAAGQRVEDIELLVITHQHMDHLGLMEVIVRRSGAEVAALHQLEAYLADFRASSAEDDAFSQAIMRRHGVPADLATVLGTVGAAFRAFGSSGAVTRPLRDNETLELRDRSLRVLHRPGHSPSDTLFYDEQRGIVLGGDHLLAHISSNPMISRPLDAAGPPAGDPAAPGIRPQALISYMESMRQTRELPARLVLPGHGPPIADHATLIDERFRLHERRAGKILTILAEGPSSAYEIALRMWGNVAVTQAYLTISEVLGHLDLLLADGRVAEHDDGERSTFQALGDRISSKR